MSETSVWAPSFTTNNWENYKAGFHPTALYKKGEMGEFVVKFNRGICPAAPYLLHQLLLTDSIMGGKGCIYETL